MKTKPMKTTKRLIILSLLILASGCSVGGAIDFGGSKTSDNTADKTCILGICF